MSYNSLQTTAGSISWKSVANWSLLLAPTTSQDVVAAASSATITSGFLNTATLASLTVPMTFTGTAGLANQAVKSVSAATAVTSTATITSTAHGYSAGDVVLVSGAVESAYNGSFTILTVADADHFTYSMGSSPTSPATGTILVKKRSELIQPATLAQFGAPGNSNVSSAGSGRWVHDFSSVQTTVTVLNTAQNSTDTALEPLRIVGTHASNVLYMLGGTCGLATSAATDLAQFLTINQSGGTLNGGLGLTWTNIYQSGGTLRLNSGSSSGVITQASGTCSLSGAGTIATITVGGTLYLDIRKASAGDTITGTLTLNDGCTLDLTRNPANISVATLVINGKVTIKTNPANPGHFSWTTLTRNPGSQITFA
jgi:hypothetical protein